MRARPARGLQMLYISCTLSAGKGGSAVYPADRLPPPLNRKRNDIPEQDTLGGLDLKRFVILPLLWAGFLSPGELAAGSWTLPKGDFWSKVTYLKQSTNQEYVSSGGQGRPPDPAVQYFPGDRARYRFDGQYSSWAVFLDLFYGITDRFDVGIQVPFFRQEFVDDALLTGFGEPRRATGFSDVRGILKFRAIREPFIGTLKLGVKAPTGQFLNEDGIIPVGEGQWDFDFILQAGRSFWPIPAYANAEIGYRLRLKNDEIDRDPGDEWIFLGEVGANPAKRILVALKLEGIRGKRATVIGLSNPSTIKRVTYLSPTVALGPFGNTSVEFALRISLNGHNFPAGQMLIAGVSYSGNPFRRR